ncbi:MAG: hypothetical protein ACE5MK_11125 [Acidobacteriota bacterium]
MLQKRIAIVILVTGVLLGAGLTLGQTRAGRSAIAKAAEKAAEQKARAGDYLAAITLYQKAIDAESNEGEKERIQTDLDKVKRHLYVKLYQQAQRANSREETIRILIQARSLSIEEEAKQDKNVVKKLGGWMGGTDKDFQKMVLDVQGRRQKIFGQLRTEGDAAARKKAYDQAVSSYEQARDLDPGLFNKANLAAEYSKIKDQIKRGKRLALEGHQLINQRRYHEAKERFRQANILYPGQAAVEDGLKRIQHNEQEYRRVRAEGDDALHRGDIANAIQSYEHAIDLDPQLADEDGLNTRLAELRGSADHLNKAREAFRKGRYAKARVEFGKVLALHPDNAEAQRYARKANSLVLLLDGKRYAKANQFDKAEEAFKMAVAKDRGNGEAARLLKQSQDYKKHVSNGRVLYKQESCEEAKRELLQAQKLNPKRFGYDDLEALLDEDCTQVRSVQPPKQIPQIPLPVAKIRQGLLALFDGRPDESIQILEMILEEIGEGHAQVHAFLGASYCHAAFLSTEPDMLALETAKEQFRMALNLQPDFQLPEKLFSPRILKIFEQLRSQTKVDPISDSNGHSN